MAYNFSASNTSSSSRHHTVNIRTDVARQVIICVHLDSIYNVRQTEIKRAAKILYAMNAAHDLSVGAIGLEGEMIDAPMIKQVLWIVVKQMRD
jgi:hypothetical protein